MRKKRLVTIAVIAGVVVLAGYLIWHEFKSNLIVDGFYDVDTSTSVSHICYALNQYYSDYHEYPPDRDESGANDSEVLYAMLMKAVESGDGQKLSPPQPAPAKMMPSGRRAFVDKYGKPIRYRRESKYECKVWAVGMNGIDEDGKGDDIARSLRQYPMEGTPSKQDRSE